MLRFKRIIEGKAYNTATATCIHSEEDESGCWVFELYRTRHGAFFTCVGDFERGEASVKPLTDEEAQKWLEDREVDAAVIEEYFGEFPEAGAAESQITLRLPGNLHRRALDSANAAGVSLNTYIMRLLERTESRSAVKDR